MKQGIHPYLSTPYVQLTMEGVCILLQEKADWDTAKKVLGEGNLIKRLMEFEKDNITEKVVRALRRVIDDVAFTPDQVGARRGLPLGGVGIIGQVWVDVPGGHVGT